MQAIPRPTGQPASVKIYNAVYSSVQVYECMVRGIAVMRRRADSFVNATQILKVAGVDKGRRTKILEKDVLPGKHEIVQGGYGKYQGTWIPLERGRDLALQYGIAPLLSPLFDFMPSQSTMGGLPSSLSNLAARGGHRPLSAAASYPSLSIPNMASQQQPQIQQQQNQQLGPAPILPGSALRLLNQGRAQGLFTPSTAAAQAAGYYPGILLPSSQPSTSSGTSLQPALKRTRTDSELDMGRSLNGAVLQDTVMSDATRPPSAAPSDREEPSPSKRARTDPPSHPSHPQFSISQARSDTNTPQPNINGLSRTHSASSNLSAGRTMNGVDSTPDRSIRMSTRPSLPLPGNQSSPLKNARRTAVLAAICQEDNPSHILNLIKDACQEGASVHSPEERLDWDLVIDDMGHTALHISTTLARLETVKALVQNGADVHRGNLQGETPLIRCVLSTHAYDSQCFSDLLGVIHPSLRTIDTANRSVLHHATLSAGVRGRAAYARYYIESVLAWIAEHEAVEFRSLVDLQDEHGDTALNVAARVGNRSLVRTLLDVGANRILPNKLGLRPGDFGVESEELAAPPKAEDILSNLRAGPSIPAQKSQDVIADMTNMIQKLSSDFSVEIKSKQDTFDVTQAHLRAATRELADQRRQISTWQQRCGELDQVSQRIRNLEKALIDEDSFDWTGRGRLAQITESFKDFDDDPPLPESNSLESLVKLRRMKAFQTQMQTAMDLRLQGLQGASTAKEFQCKKIVALCTSIPIDKVEDMLENLVIAVESESQIIDIGRVSGFMQKVREGVL